MLIRDLIAAAVVATAAIVAPAVVVQAQDEASTPRLAIGDKAPKLENLTWHQGRIESFEPGKVYVLDFWATWCGPCIAAMPHMNKVTEQYKDDGVTVIGLAVWPNARMTPVADFLQARNESDQALKYLIAEDNAEATNATAYMRAAGQGGIPTVMIVNRSGQVAWIGHPMGGMDEALKDIVEGTYDLDKARAEFLVQQEKNRKMEVLQPKLRQAYMSQEWETVLSLFDEMMAIDPDQYGGMLIDQYAIIATQMKDKSRAKTQGQRILASKLGEQDGAMNAFAWFIVNPSNGMAKEDRDLDLAMEAINRAVGMTKGENADILDTQARVYFWKGDYAKAVQIQTKAVELASEQMRANLQEALDEYKELAGQ